MRIAFVSTYPPRRDGIATFSEALGASVGERVVVALQPPDQELPFPFEVAQRIRRDEPDDYLKTARVLNARVDAVSIQHDFRIWGGPEGAYVLDFVDALDVPILATLHAVPALPTAGQRAILQGLAERVAAVVVMSSAAADRLVSGYGFERERIETIPHGVPNLPLLDPETIKPGLGLAGREVIVSFGLLGPNKGYELAIDALPAIVRARPTACFVILGPTRPDLVRSDGEAYRHSLIARAGAHGLTDHVRFVERYLGRVDLSRWLEAADVVLTPYPDLDRVVSGTLSYAMGAGRVVVSTPYDYARDLLADERGIVLPGRAPKSLSTAVVALLRDDERRARIGQRAYDHARSMTWPVVGAAYRRRFEALIRTHGARPALARAASA